MASPFRPDVLKGKVALVTGGGSGIGFEITRQLGLHGAKVVISGRRKEVLENATASLRNEGIDASFVQGDVRKYESCEAMVAGAVKQYGRLDILVNCAAGNFLALPEELSSNGFRTVLEIDTLGTFNVSRAAFAALRDSGAGRVINISATLHHGATWFQAHASAAKAAIDSLTRSLALEWGSFGIRVNGVAPGPIRGTAGMEKLAPGAGGALNDAAVARIPLGHMGEKEDIALACVYLSSPAGRFVSGHTMVVDGAESLHKEQIVPRAMVSSVSRGVEGKSRKVGIGGSKL